MKTKAVATRLEQDVADKFEALAQENHLLPSELARIILSAWATGEFYELVRQATEGPPIVKNMNDVEMMDWLIGCMGESRYLGRIYRMTAV